MDPIKIIEKYYDKDSKLYNLLISHSRLVARKALSIAKNVPELNPDLDFIYEAAMLHDIGIIFVLDQNLNSIKGHKYIEHGYLGRELLEKEGFPRHALVCERHTGVGISKQDIIQNKLPLPKRDMIPLSVEEKIISFADLFYTKYPGREKEEKSIEEIKKNIGSYSKANLKVLKSWCKMFNVPYS